MTTDQRDQDVPRLTTILLWLAGSCLLLSVPYINDLQIVPTWLDWLLKGSDGQTGKSWFFLGLLWLVITIIRAFYGLSWRYSSKTLFVAGEAIRSGLLLAMFLGGLLFVALFGALLVTSFLPDFTNAAMRRMGIGREALGSNTDEKVVGAMIAVAAVFSIMSAYRRSRKSDEPQIDLMLVMWMGSATIFVMAMVAMGAFVWVTALVGGVPRWFPNQFGDWQKWNDDNLRTIVGIAVGASLAAIPLIHYLRLCLWNGVGSKPTFLSAAWIMFWIKGGLGLTVFVLALLAAVLR